MNRPPSDSLRHPGPCNAFRQFERGEIEQSISARFEAQAARRSSAPAIADGALRLSYGELNGLANRIARAILEAASADGGPIALLFEHGAMAVAAMLGVLKSGHFYVPLSPRLPAARLRTILEDSQATLILTNRLNAPLARAAASAAAAPLLVDSLGEHLPEHGLELAIAPDALAYILYTSGSTGVPKGVVQNHRCVLHNVMRYTNCAHIAEDDRFSLLGSYDVGASASNIFGALLNGASLHSYDLSLHGFTNLPAWMADERITVCHATPQVFRRFAESLPASRGADSLRLLRLAGETLAQSDLELYRRCCPEQTLLLSLGTTEMNVVRMFFADHRTSCDGPVVPVGYGLPDTEIVLLDDKGRESDAGEIAIRSAYLFRGYWRKPELAAAVLSRCADGRHQFRTGDYGVMLPDGCLVHLGRCESRLKIRGFTVETAEVEAELMADPSVRQAVVVGRDDRSGETRLVAYIVGDAAPAELRRRLAQRLPGEMVPAAFVRLDALPTMDNGKLDRRALPEPRLIGDDFVLPRNPDELLIARIWSEVLGVWPMGVCNEFFELGGDSLLALELITRLEGLSRKSLPLPLLLGAATVERQAAILRDADWSPSWPTVATLQPHGDAPGFFCVPGAGAGVLALMPLARRFGREYPFFALQPPGLDTARPPLRSVGDLADYFVRAIRAGRGPYFLGGASFGGVVALAIAQQLWREGEEVALVALLDSFGPGYPRLRWDAPLRFRFFRLFGDRYPKAPDFGWSKVVRELSRLWGLRLRVLSHRLSGRATPQRVRYAHWLDVAGAARRRHRVQPYRGPVALFRLKSQPSEALYHSESLRGWDDESLEGLEVIDLDLALRFPGAHSEMLIEPHVGIVAEKLHERLQTARAVFLESAAPRPAASKIALSRGRGRPENSPDSARTRP